MSLVFSLADNPWFRFVTHCYYWTVLSSIHVKNLLDEIWKLVNLVSYVRQQRGSPWLNAFGIFRNNSCLLELQGGTVYSTEYAIL